MRLYVPLTKHEFDALRDLARNERRRPQDQAAVIIARSLAGEPPERNPDAITDHADVSRRSPHETEYAVA